MALVCVVVYLLMVNFFRCPLRLFGQDTERIVVAPADGKIVVIEEVDEHEYFHDRRIMVSIFMSILNVQANWYPVDGVVKKVSHENGKFMKAWLPKASTENERSMVVIETPEGVEVMARQIAGAMARRIVFFVVLGFVCFFVVFLGFFFVFATFLAIFPAFELYFGSCFKRFSDYSSPRSAYYAINPL